MANRSCQSCLYLHHALYAEPELARKYGRDDCRYALKVNLALSECRGEMFLPSIGHSMGVGTEIFWQGLAAICKLYVRHELI